MNLAEAFYLAEGRKNFQINVRASEEDRKAYFGKRDLNKKLISEIKQSYTMGLPPKKIVHGLWGSGKTHTLFNIKYQLEESTKAQEWSTDVKCCFVEAEFRSKTDFRYLHSQMLKALGVDDVQSVVQGYLRENAAPDLDKQLRDFFGDADVAHAINTLGVGTNPVNLWKWLCADKLSASALNNLGLTKNLTTTGEMVNALVSISRLFEKKGIHYLFLLDEMEGLRKVEDSDAQTSIHDGFRRLADSSNNSVGFIVAMHGAGESDFPKEAFWQSDVIGRIGRNNVHDLEYLKEQDEVETFLEDLCELVISSEKLEQATDNDEVPGGLKLYPFDDLALEQFVDRAQQVAGACLPRNIIKAVNECAAQAAMRDSRVIEVEDLEPIDRIFVEESIY